MPTHRRPQSCRRLLEALTHQTLGCEKFEVIVVDDASADETPGLLREMAEKLPYRLNYRCLPVNSGPAPARNLGWRLADAPVVAFIDDDCVPRPQWLQSGAELFSVDDQIGLVQGPVLPPENYWQEDWPAWHHRQEIRVPSPFFEGCNVFYRKEALEAAGGFDEKIGWWGEDTALGYAVLASGQKRAWAPGAEVIHDVTARGWKWNVRMAFLERNLVKLGARYPAMREQAFWRPWAFRRTNALFALAVVAGVASLKFRSAMVLVGPYLWVTRFAMSHRPFGWRWLQTVAIDAARFCGHLNGSWAAKRLVL